MRKIALFIVFIFSLISTVVAQSVCTIKGVVVGRPSSKVLYLSPFDSDYRIMQPIEITVKSDGTFSYDMKFDHVELYELAFKDDVERGHWMSERFVLEGGTVEFKLHDDENFFKNICKGEEMNRQFRYLDKGINDSYRDEIDSLATQLYDVLGENAYSAEYIKCRDSLSIEGISSDQRNKLFKRLNKLSLENRKYNDQGNAINMELKVIYDHIGSEKLEIIANTRSEASLAQLYQLLIMASNPPEVEKCTIYKELFDKYYKNRYPDNPMSHKIIEIFAGFKVKVGGDFVDFEAPDLEGNMCKFSELIKGKVVVLDLWASWCGPCMRTSKSFIPIWEKYRDRGFDIVGVAREKNDTKAMQEAIKRLGLKWLNLVELNDRAKIWSKYSAGNSGGKVILIDRKGKIVAMDFTADELEQYLEELF